MFRNMKQVTITTGKATIVVVDLPEETILTVDEFISEKGNINRNPVLEVSKAKRYLIYKGIPDPDIYKHLGHPSQLTAEDWKGIVDDCMCAHNYPGHPNYIYDKEDFPYIASLVSATESGISLLKANGVVIENPRGDQPHNTGLVHLYPTGHPIDDIALKEAIDWLEAQSKVWLNPQIFVKL